MKNWKILPSSKSTYYKLISVHSIPCDGLIHVRYELKSLVKDNLTHSGLCDDVPGYKGVQLIGIDNMAAGH